MSDTSTARLPMTVVVELTPAKIAQAFCELDDDAQAQFFVESAKIMRGWTHSVGGWDYQAWLAGRHLRTCSCSSEDARDLVRALASGLGSAS